LDADRSNPLLAFRLILRTHFSPMSTWIDTAAHQRLTKTVGACPPVTQQLIATYVRRWIADGLLPPLPSTASSPAAAATTAAAGK
jgi:hypothetical protein